MCILWVLTDPYGWNDPLGFGGKYDWSGYSLREKGRGCLGLRRVKFHAVYSLSWKCRVEARLNAFVLLLLTCFFSIACWFILIIFVSFFYTFFLYYDWSGTGESTCDGQLPEIKSLGLLWLQMWLLRMHVFSCSFTENVTRGFHMDSWWLASKNVYTCVASHNIHQVAHNPLSYRYRPYLAPDLCNFFHIKNIIHQFVLINV